MSSAVSPQPGRYTVADWETLDESTWPRVELIAGEFSVVPPPTGQHQWSNDQLRMALFLAARDAGRDDLWVVSGVGVVIAAPQAFVPDIAVLNVRPEGKKFTADQLELGVEIVSPGTTAQDRLSKPAAYAKAGVPFYWRVEPGTRTSPGPTLVCCRLRDNVYVEETTLTAGTRATTGTGPFPVTLDPADLLP